MTQSLSIMEKLDYVHVPNKETNLPFYSDKVILPQSILESLINQQKAFDLQSLPHPLIFKISSPSLSCYAGVKEFISNENEIELSGLLLEKLGIACKDDSELEINTLQVELIENIPKGKNLSLKPMEIYEDVTNWKWFLEAKLTSNYTTLTQGDLLTLKDESTGKMYKLMVSMTSPGSTICIIDTDINLDVEPLDDEMAKQLLEKRKHLEKFQDIQTGKEYTVTIGQKLKVNLGGSVNIGISGNADFIVSNNEYISKDNFIWSTLNSGVKKLHITNNDESLRDTLYLIPIGTDYHEAKIEVESEYIEESSTPIATATATVEPIDSDRTICSNCGSQILKSSQFMHENFCRRNNMKCPHGCNKIFLKKIPETHWHCCSTYGDSSTSLKLHQDYYHFESETCPLCQNYRTSPKIDLCYHIAAECPQSLHECQFCHLVIPKGTHESFESRISGRTPHEYDCGSKTTECFKCGKVVRLRDFETHFKLHELQRKSKPKPIICSNKNCVRSITSNHNNSNNRNNILDMCDFCYGPFYSTVYDPNYSKLKGRVERRYMIQLTQGCGNSWCTNPNCKSSGLIPDGKFGNIGDLIKHVKTELLKGNDSVSNINDFWFCVDNQISKKKLIADFLISDPEFEYDSEWCCKAVGEVKFVDGDDTGNLSRVKSWLAENAVKRGE